MKMLHCVIASFAILVEYELLLMGVNNKYHYLTISAFIMNVLFDRSRENLT